MSRPPLTPQSLEIDCEAAVRSICTGIRSALSAFRRRGAVIGLSGGIDSSVTAALCVRALGPERVFGLHMPDRDSSPETLPLSRSISDHFGFASAVEDVTAILEATGCYRRQVESVREVVPEYGPDWKCKIVLASSVHAATLNHFRLVAQAPDGRTVDVRLTSRAYLGIVAATNFKQRARKMLEYYHADRLNYGVAGTPNRLEYDQGFFVKLGDGAADIKPIAHLYKSQVYQLAAFLGVPETVRSRPPTTDTYSLPQGQDEFYFSLPYPQMDLCLYALNHGYTAEEAAEAAGLAVPVVEKVFRDIAAKRETTRYLHAPARLMAPVPEAGFSAARD